MTDNTEMATIIWVGSILLLPIAAYFIHGFWLDARAERIRPLRWAGFAVFSLMAIAYHIYMNSWNESHCPTGIVNECAERA